MINDMSTSLLLPGRYTTLVMRDWDYFLDREVLWLLFELDYPVKGGAHMRSQVSSEASSILGRHARVVRTVDPEHCRFSKLWIAGPITEQEAAHIERTHPGD